MLANVPVDVCRVTNIHPPETARSDSRNSRFMDDTAAPAEPVLALPAPGDADDVRHLVVNAGGTKLDHLGPIILNADGTMARIENWSKYDHHLA